MPPIPKPRRIAALWTLVALALFGSPAFAAAVYRCAGQDGAIAFQDRPCAAGATQRVVEITVNDPPPDPRRAVDARVRDTPSRSSGSGRRLRASEPASYECRSESGLVFYRHSRCPSTIAVPSIGPGKPRRVAVHARSMPRSAACRLMRNIARDGEELDEKASTYDRNLGRDTCRGY